MRRYFVYAIAVTLYSAVAVQAQVGTPGIQYSNTVAGGDGVQLYPYDQQDPWVHGYFQRYPAYGGFSSFRPYNYRHVFAQTQLGGTWGLPHGMPYSQQFWNKYRGSYLDQNLHSQAAPSVTPEASFTATTPMALPPIPVNSSPMPVYPTGNVRSIGYQSLVEQVVPSAPSVERLDSIGRPVSKSGKR